MKTISLVILLIATMSVANAQTLRLPEHVKLTPAQHKELFTYFEKAPLLEKFYLMTSIPHQITTEQAEYANQNFQYRSNKGVYINFDELQTIRDTIFTADYLMQELKYLKMLKNNQLDLTDSDCKIIDFKIDHSNGYVKSLVIPGPQSGAMINSTSRVLTYWKYGDNSYIIGTNYYQFMSESDGEVYSVPTMYRYQNDTLTQVNLSKIVKPNYPTKYSFSAECKWYDLFTPDEYLVAEYEEIDCVWSYILPSTGTTITVGSPVGDAWAGIASTSYLVQYKWNGDGTFTKIGRSDDRISEFLKKDDEMNSKSCSEQ